MRDQRIQIPVNFRAVSWQEAAPDQDQLREANNARVAQPDPLAQVTCRLGDHSCAQAHADTMGRARSSQPMNSPQSLRRLQQQYGNHYVQRVLQLTQRSVGRAETRPQKLEEEDEKCAECGQKHLVEQTLPGRHDDETGIAARPRTKYFDPEDVVASEEEGAETEGEAEMAKPAFRSNHKGVQAGSQQSALAATPRPHNGAATIKCVSGDYAVDLGAWAGTSCDRPDCVTVHEESHKKDWKKRWPNGCKQADGSNQPDGYLPLGGDGYAAFLKQSECDAHIADLKCAADKLKAATGGCKTTWQNYIKETKDEKKRFC